MLITQVPIGGWQFEERIGPPDDLFDETSKILRSWADGAVRDRRLIRLLRVDRPAIALGSAQSIGDLRESIMRPVVVRRSSGGGAVWLEPESIIWLDVLIERGDPHWLDDVGRAAWWIGDAVSEGLVESGFDGFTTHRGALVNAPGSRQVCWIGTGAGEVVKSDNPAQKIVGIAQKRTRHQVLFQVGVLMQSCQFRLAPWFGLDPAAVTVSEAPAFPGPASSSPLTTLSVIENLVRAITSASAMPPRNLTRQSSPLV